MRRKHLIHAALLTACGAVVAPALHAQCNIELPMSGTVNVDGTLDPGEWAGAATYTSGASCVAEFFDWPVGNPWLNTPGGTFDSIPDVGPSSFEVRAQRDASFIYLSFEVQDRTFQRPDGTPLLSGERVIVHLDPDGSGSDSLTFGAAPTADWRVEIKGIRSASEAGGLFQAFDAMPPGAFPMACGVSFQTTPTTGTSFLSAVGTTNVDYVVEMRIPIVTLFGGGGLSSTAVMRMSFAVVNDFGVEAPDGHRFGNAAAFPLGMEINQDDMLLEDLDSAAGEPAFTACGDWRQPFEWGFAGAFGAFQVPDVYMHHPAQPWHSQDITLVRACDDTPSGGTYYEDDPCDISGRITLRLTDGALQPGGGNRRFRVRLLFVFGNRDAGSPKWTTWSLQEFDVAAGSSFPCDDPATASTALEDACVLVQSASFDPTSTTFGLDLNGVHPCMRVAIISESFTALPPTPTGTYSQANVSGWLEQPHGEFVNMMNAWGQPAANNWAQKNLSLNSTDPCPCSQAQDGDPQPSALGVVLAPAQSPPVAEPGQPASEAARTFLATATGPSDADIARVPSSRAVPQQAPPPFGLTAAEWRFGVEAVVIQVTTFGVKTTATDSGPYALIQPIGGAIEIVPGAQILDGSVHTIPFSVTNPIDGERVIIAHVESYVPGYLASVPGLDVVVDRGEALSLDAGETGETRVQIVEPPRRRAFSIHAGLTLPVGTFGNAIDPGPSARLDLEVPLPNSAFTLELIGGLHFLKDVDVYQGSVNVKRYLPLGSAQAFVNAGAGAYRLDPGTTESGFNAGGGIQFNPAAAIIFEALGNYHRINTPGSATEMISLHLGIRWHP